jgi:hypothetical protein
MSLADQEKLLKQITTPQLIAILDGRSATLTSQQAVNVILSRNIPNRIEVIDLILERQKEPETRIAAIKNLSRQIDPHAQELLIKAGRPHINN